MGRHNIQLFFVSLMLVVSLVYFFRGSLCAVRDSRDFATVYLSSRAWLQGLDPYDASAFPSIWAQAGGSADELPNQFEVPALYPITTLLLLSPLAAFQWEVSKILWLTVNLGSLAASIGALFLIGGLRGRTKFLILTAISFSLCSLHNAIGMGSPTIITVFLGVSSIFLSQIKRDTWAGVALGLCLCVKPHLGLPFFVYYLIVRRSGVVYSCLALVCLISLAVCGKDGYFFMVSDVGEQPKCRTERRHRRSDLL